MVSEDCAKVQSTCRCMFYLVECSPVVGVPDPPVIRLRPGMENILEWNTPLSRGPMILFYTVEVM